MKKEIVFINKLKQEIEFTIGENARDNFDVIDQANPEDYWFHIHNESSCHVTAFVPEGLDRKERGYIIKKGAEICKKYSRQKSQKNVEIIYTRVRCVSKTDIPGQVETTDTNIVKI